MSANIDCFPKAQILTPHGLEDIGSLDKKQTVYCWNFRKHEPCERIAERIDVTGLKEIMELSYVGASQPVTVTEDHRLLTESGWKRVDEFRYGDNILVLNNARLAARAVTKLCRAKDKQPVYTLAVEGENNFIADGIVALGVTRVQSVLNAFRCIGTGAAVGIRRMPMNNILAF